MKRIKLIFFIIFCGYSSAKLSAQSYIEFVENKGQWDKQVLYKGELTTGAFLLKADGGYRMVLHNHDDLSAIAGSHQLKNNVEVKLSEMAVTSTKSSTEIQASKVLHSHVYEVKFLNANPNPQIISDKPLNTYNNYFIGNDPSKWASDCKVFQAITYKNVYPNVDVRYYTNNGQLKYDIIVNPGGDANAVALYFDGVNSLKLKDGTLNIKTSVDEVKEMPPSTYQMQQVGHKEVDCRYDVKGNIVRFKFDHPLSKTSTLVIDPQLIFSTFTGSKASNWGYTATYDAAGNFYAGGIVFGTGFPVSNGAFQTGFGGSGNGNGFDIGIIKFSSDGSNRIYATYIGGSGNEQPHSLVVDGSGNLIIAGRTSSSDYPTKAPNKYGPCGGDWDIILSKLSADGKTLIGSLTIGGSGPDGVNIQDKEVACPGSTTNTAGRCDISIRRNYGDDARSEVIIDGSGNIYLASSTQSTNFPTTANAFQTTKNISTAGYMQDAVVIKASPDLSTILFSTLLGGSGDDAAFVLALNPFDNNIYVAGGTASADFPGINNDPLVIQNTFQKGNCDGFVSIISNDGSSLIKTSYFGTVGDENIYGIQFDKFGFPYIMGTTTGSWVVKNATYRDEGGKQFISKLKPDLTDYVYSTVFGTKSDVPNISPTAFLVDRCENVYVSGWGGLGNTATGYASAGTSGLVASPGAIQPTTDGSDFYFFVLERNANSKLYSSFFGQRGGNYPDHVDGGTSRFDRNGIIYQAMCANCNGPAGIFPTSAGVWSPDNAAVNAGAGACNLAAIKIRFDLAGVAAGIQSTIKGRIRDTSACVPTTAFFKDTIKLAKQYIWDFNDGTPRQSTTLDTISHTFQSIGLYKVMMIGIDSTSCNISDTSFVTMRIRNDEAALSLIGNKLPPCTSLSYQFTNTSVPPAGKPFNSNSFRIDFGDGSSQIMGAGTVTHAYAAIGTYNIGLVLMDTSYCNQADSAAITIRLAPNVKALFTTPALGCVPYTAIINNTSVGGTDFTWDFGDGTTSTQVNPTHLYANTGNYTIKLVATDTATCNKVDSTSFTVSVNVKPVAAFTAAPQPPKSNIAIVFTNTSLGAVAYKWFFGDGDSVLANSIASVSHIYNASGTFNTCLIAFNAAGCTDTVCQNITAIITPLFDVPNAFSPNGDGVNDIIFIKGFGISKMKWSIYNRWGTLVFESADKNIGWDGTFKGTLQAQDVYHYVLQVEMSNGAKYIKNGDITLLR